MKSRNTLWLLTFCGFGINYMLRININIAIVEMVKQRSSKNETERGQCYESNLTNRFTNYNESDASITNKYDWDEHEQNLVLGSYYWLHWLSQLPGGLLAHYYGSKRVFGYANFSTALLTFVIPMSTYYGLYFLVALRFLQGFLAGCVWPSMHLMVAKWIPPMERGKFMSSYLGSSAGAAFTYFICGYIIDWFGWEYVFYITGAIGSIWSLAWAIMVYDTPQQHPWISRKEKEFIEESIGAALNKDKLPIPWKSILTSRFVWMNAIAQWGSTGGTFALLTHTPMYLKLIHGLQVKSTGVISGLPHLTRSIFSFVFGILNQYQTCLSPIHFRKFASGLCTIGVGILFGFLAYSGCNTEIAIILLFATITLQGTVTSGPYASVIDMTPNFSSIVQGMTGMISVTPGFIYPLVVGYLTQNNQTLVQWQKYFFIVAGMCICCGILDCIFGTSELQPWNSMQKKIKEMKPLKKTEIIKS